MEWVAKVQTSDGVLHENRSKAERHAEKRYGEALTKLALEAVRVEKYRAMAQFIEDHLPRFAELSALKADCTLTPNDLFGED